MDHRQSGNREYAVFQGISPTGLVLWLYETDWYELAQLQRVSELGIWGDLYCLVEGGTVVALELRTGQVRWTNDEFVGGNPAVTWDENYHCLCGYDSPYRLKVDPATLETSRP